MRAGLDDHRAILEDLETRLEGNDASANIDFSRFLKMPDVGSHIAELLALHTTEFVQQQLARLQQIRKQREFTLAELKLGREVLPSLLNSIKELL